MSERNHDAAATTCDLLGAYELGLLDHAASLDFENHLTDCVKCLEDLHGMAPATVALTADPDRFARAAENTLAAPEAGLGGKIASFCRELLRIRVLVPAAVTAVLALALILPQLDSGSGFADLALVEPAPYASIEVRAGGGDLANRFQTGMEHYLAGEYRDAAEDLVLANMMMDAWPDDAEALQPGLHDQTRIYLGVSRLMAGQQAAALAPLEAALDSPIRPLASRAGWYLAQGYLLTEQPNEATGVLTRLADDPVYGAQASELLARIEAR